MQRLTVAIFFCLILSVSAFPQDRGIIRCGAAMDQVPAWTAPGRPHVVEQLSCDQMVSIIGLEQGYVKIQIGDKTAYVDAKYVRIQESQDRRISQLEEQVKRIQQTTATPAPGISRPSQYPSPRASNYEAPTRFDMTGMFTWVRAFKWPEDFLGWDATFVGRITENFGLEAGVSGNYWLSPTNIVGQHYYSFSGGPRFTFPGDRVSPYIHCMVGLARVTGDFLGISASENVLLLSPGFGMDVNINRRFAIRVIQADYPVLYNDGTWSYKNMRIGGGIVTRF